MVIIMKILLVAIDSKYIHTNMALRYLKANLDFESTLIEFTIKDDIKLIKSAILKHQPDIIGFSVYLWNVDLIIQLAPLIKAESSAIIVLGGPEVSYDSEFFIDNNSIDFIISGEGEIAFNELIKSISDHSSFSSISGLTYRENHQIKKNPTVDIINLNELKNPYHFPEDIAKLPTRIQYIEMSRGCPFHCSYCLASLEKNVRFFDIERVKNDILYLMSHGAKTFKFLDRTFNYKIENALEIFDFIINNHLPGTQFQFEITGDLLSEKIIEYVNSHAPHGLIRFEIGIQSTNELTNLSVNRFQNNEKLFQNIRSIQKGNVIDLHLDLIAGLPYENLERFSKTFDEVFSLYPKELQLGFLKMLRGTKIRREAEKYGYAYHTEPPYEMISNHDLFPDDLKTIHQVEDVLEVFWNKGFMPQTMRYILSTESSAFQFMYRFSIYLLANQFNFHRYQRFDLFIKISEFMKHSNLHNEQFMFEITNEYLLKSKIKPHIWWDNYLPKHQKTELFNNIIKHHPSIKLDDLYKYSVITRFNNCTRIYLFYPKEIRVLIDDNNY